MSRTPQKYALEIALERVVKEFKELMIAMKKFFFTPPKDKGELLVYLLSVVPWLLFIWGVIYSIGR